MKTASSIHDPRQRVISATLKKARLDKRLTQDELAKIMDVSRIFISKTESGDRNLTLIELIDYCAALEINIHEIISGIIGEKVSEELHDNDLFLKAYAIGFLHGTGETPADNPISARIVHREKDPDKSE